jgi:hypothetical protein
MSISLSSSRSAPEELMPSMSRRASAFVIAQVRHLLVEARRRRTERQVATALVQLGHARLIEDLKQAVRD